MSSRSCDAGPPILLSMRHPTVVLNVAKLSPSQPASQPPSQHWSTSNKHTTRLPSHLCCDKCRVSRRCLFCNDTSFGVHITKQVSTHNAAHCVCQRTNTAQHCEVFASQHNYCSTLISITTQPLALRAAVYITDPLALSHRASSSITWC